VVVADLSSREVVTSSERRRVLVERWFAIFVCCAIREMWKTEKPWLLWLPLLLEVFRIHLPAAENRLYGRYGTETGIVEKKSTWARNSAERTRWFSGDKIRDSDDS
jgi:hypothetical protein